MSFGHLVYLLKELKGRLWPYYFWCLREESNGLCEKLLVCSGVGYPNGTPCPLENYSVIRVASLVEKLESNVRLQASLLKCRRCKIPFSMVNNNDDKVKMSGNPGKRIKSGKSYPFGSGLLQFMEERGLIGFLTDVNSPTQVMRKKGNYYLP